MQKSRQIVKSKFSQNIITEIISKKQRTRSCLKHYEFFVSYERSSSTNEQFTFAKITVSVAGPVSPTDVYSITYSSVFVNVICHLFYNNLLIK